MKKFIEWLQTRPIRIKNFFLRLYYSIKYFIQRGKRGYSDFDLMDLDSYLLDLIPNMLIDLKNKKDGYPANLKEEIWDEILNTMIECFKNANPSMTDYKNPYLDEYYKKVVSTWSKNMIDSINKNKDIKFISIDMRIPEEYKELYDNYKEKKDEEELYRQENLEKGFEILMKFFHYLWY